MSEASYRVWWIPQVPMKSFEFDVDTLAEGRTVCAALGRYDAFQFENNVKPDYCNAGGVQWAHPVLTEGEWWDVEDEITDEAELFESAT